MATAKDYPQKLFADAPVIIKNRSINHYCTLNQIRNMMKGIGEDAYRAIEHNSCLRVILKLANSNYMFSSRHVQYLLAAQLDIKKDYELWVLVNSQPIRFSLNEFEDITGLNCGLVDESSAVEEVAHGDLWKDVGLPVGESPTLIELNDIIADCKDNDWSIEKRKMLGVLLILHVGVFGINKNSRIPYNIDVATL